jgi:hypothetical protein
VVSLNAGRALTDVVGGVNPTFNYPRNLTLYTQASGS